MSNEETTVPSQGKAFTQELWENALNGTAGDATFEGPPPTWAEYQRDKSINGVWGQYRMRAVLKVHYTTSRYSCAHYNDAGYDKDAPQAITKFNGTAGMLGIIYKVQHNAPGTGI